MDGYLEIYIVDTIIKLHYNLQSNIPLSDQGFCRFYEGTFKAFYYLFKNK